MNCPYIFAHSFWFFSKFRNSLCIRVISALCDKCCKYLPAYYFLPLTYLLLLFTFFLTIQNSFIKDINSSFYCSWIFSHRNVFPFQVTKEFRCVFFQLFRRFHFYNWISNPFGFYLLYSMRNRFNFIIFHMVNDICLNITFLKSFSPPVS